MPEWVWLNGELVERSRAMVSVDDRAFLLGDGLFETMRAYDGKIFMLNEHLERLERGLRRMDIHLPYALQELGRAAEGLVAKNRLATARVRLTVSRGIPEGHRALADFSRPFRPTVLISAGELQISEEIYARGWRALTWPQPVAGVPFPDLKSTSYAPFVLARAAAVNAGLDEALVRNARGRICEGAMSNLFWVEGESLLTPPLSEGCLAGITRAAVTLLARVNAIAVREQALERPRLLSADEAFLTSSVMELVPLCEIDGQLIGKGRPGKLVRRLHSLYREHVKRQLRSGR